MTANEAGSRRPATPVQPSRRRGPRRLGLLTRLVPAATAGPAAAHLAPRTLAFEANRGQIDAQVQFVARGGAYTAFLTSTEAVLVLGDGRTGRAVLRVKPIGADAAAL